MRAAFKAVALHLADLSASASSAAPSAPWSCSTAAFAGSTGQKAIDSVPPHHPALRSTHPPLAPAVLLAQKPTGRGPRRL